MRLATLQPAQNKPPFTHGSDARFGQIVDLIDRHLSFRAAWYHRRAMLLPPELPRKIVQRIWRYAPSLPLQRRIRNLRRTQHLVMLGRAFDRNGAAGVAEQDASEKCR